MIDLTLNSILIPDITGYTPPFGTKVARTAINKGGLSTQEVNNNIIASFVKMRGVVITTSDSTSDIEYDAKLLIEANAAITLTLGNATYRGCRVSIVNATSFTHTLNCTSVSTNAPIILPNTSFEIIWTGTAWKSLSAPAVGKRVTQFPQEEPPSTTYPCTKWELLSFDGAFFRTEGTNANQFIDKTGVLIAQNQGTAKNGLSLSNTLSVGNSPSGGAANVTTGMSANNKGFIGYGIPSQNPTGEGFVTVRNPRTVDLWGDNKTYICDGYDIDISHTHNIYLRGSISLGNGDIETRPKNYTIRVWKRIA